MLEVRADRPIDPMLQQILRQVCEVTATLDLEFFVGGAMARDILLTHVFGQKLARATRDVDLGLYVNDWDEFKRLKEQLVRSGHFVEDRTMAQRLHHRSRLPLDLIPFGGVATKNQAITWPPSHEIVLNVAGFADALRSAIMVDLGDGLQVKTCSLPALAVLKLIAWKDRGLENNKDATDFLLIARLYGPAQNEERLYATERELLYAADGDPELAGAQLLGKDAAMQCRPDTAQQVSDLLADGMLRQRLSDQLLRAQSGSMQENDAVKIEKLIGAFIRGFVSTRQLSTPVSQRAPASARIGRSRR
jgi:predicted nucleotidyltransferase